MKKFLIFIIILISACSTSVTKKDSTNNIIFSNDISFEQIKLKLKEYAKNSSYPNIDD